MSSMVSGWNLNPCSRSLKSSSSGASMSSQKPDCLASAKHRLISASVLSLLPLVVISVLNAQHPDSPTAQVRRFRTLRLPQRTVKGRNNDVMPRRHDEYH